MPTDAETFFESQIPFNRSRIRTAVVYCSDGRFGEQVDDLLHVALELPRDDRLSVPGGASCLAQHFVTHREQAAILEQLRFLVEVLQLETVVLIAYEECAFYTQRLRISPWQLESQQRQDFQKAV